MKKYLRTYHLPFSPEIVGDDKKIDESILVNFQQKNIVITEKLDGGNCCVKPNVGVFARTHALPTHCESFDCIKNIHYYAKLHILNPNYWYFGENTFAIHSIVYDNLIDTFYLFGIYDTINKNWLSWEDTILEAKRCKFLIVPVIYQGVMLSLQELEKFLTLELKKDSMVGGQREGFVIRYVDSFIETNITDGFEHIVKYVRKGHVQSDEHWTKNWKPQKINWKNSNKNKG